MARENPSIKIDSTELLNNFRAALNKEEQIKIEADLHCCAPQVIAELLDQLGALEGTGLKPQQFSNRYQPVAAAGPARNRYKFDTAKALRLYRKGISINGIGEKCGVSHTSIENWVRNEGLTRPPIKPGRKPTKKNQKPKFKLEGSKDVKKERPVEEALLDKEAEQERHERILASVDAGKRCEPCEPTLPEGGECDSAKDIDVPDKDVGELPDLPRTAPICCQPGRAVDVWDGYTVPDPPRILMEPRETAPMSVKQFRVAMCRLLSDAMDDAALSINGETVRDIFGVEIVVRGGRVLVDLRTREAS